MAKHFHGLDYPLLHTDPQLHRLNTCSLASAENSLIDDSRQVQLKLLKVYIYTLNTKLCYALGGFFKKRSTRVGLVLPPPPVGNSLKRSTRLSGTSFLHRYGGCASTSCCVM